MAFVKSRDEARIELAVDKLLIVHQRPKESQCGFDTADLILHQRPPHTVDRLVTGPRMNRQF